jgi:hypothetical protein
MKLVFMTVAAAKQYVIACLMMHVIFLITDRTCSRIQSWCKVDKVGRQAI